MISIRMAVSYCTVYFALIVWNHGKVNPLDRRYVRQTLYKYLSPLLFSVYNTCMPRPASGNICCFMHVSLLRPPGVIHSIHIPGHFG